VACGAWWLLRARRHGVQHVWRAPVGRRLDFFYEPTVVSGLDQDDEMIQQEIFGPVVTVQRFDGDEKAWPGPTASSTASPPAPGPATAAAPCAWPAPSTSAACGSAPKSDGRRDAHGGFKHSGYGKDLSLYEFEVYTGIKRVMSNIEG
jgi:betaine-aldehyde dehydrogenase